MAKATLRSVADLLGALQKSQLLDEAGFAVASTIAGPCTDPRSAADKLIGQGLVTPWQAQQLAAGQFILKLGDYRLLDEQPGWEFGRVFWAQHATQGERVCLRLLAGRFVQDEATWQVFRGDLRKLAALKHPHLVTFRELTRAAQRYFLISEIWTGARLDELRGRWGRPSAARTAHVLEQLAAALQAMHERTTDHGLLCPGRVAITPAGDAKLLEPGLSALAKSFSAKNESAPGPWTQFTAPPDWPPRDDSQRCDLYALGGLGQWLSEECVPASPNSVPEWWQAGGDDPSGWESLRQLAARLQAVPGAQPLDSAGAARNAFHELASRLEQPATSKDDKDDAEETGQQTPANEDDELRLEAEAPATATTGPEAAGSSAPTEPRGSPPPIVIQIEPRRGRSTAPGAAPLDVGSLSQSRRRRQLRRLLVTTALAVTVLLMLSFAYGFKDRFGRDSGDLAAGPRAARPAKEAEPERNADVQSDPELQADPLTPAGPVEPPATPAAPGPPASRSDVSAPLPPAPSPPGGGTADTAPVNSAPSIPAPPAETAVPVAAPSPPVAAVPDAANPTAPATPPEMKPAEPPVASVPPAPPAPPSAPFRELPAALALPAISPPAPTPVALGKILIDDGVPCNVELLGGEAVGRNNQSLKLENARGGTAEREWEVFVSKGAEGRNAVARLSLEGQQFLFVWLGSAAAEPLAGQLENCFLRATVGDANVTLALRQPIEVDALLLDIDRGVTEGKWELSNCPDLAACRLELLRPEGNWPPILLEPSGGIGVKDGKQWMFLGEKRDQSLLALAVEVSLKRSLQIEITSLIQLGYEPAPTWLKDRDRRTLKANRSRLLDGLTQRKLLAERTMAQYNAIDLNAITNQADRQEAERRKNLAQVELERATAESNKMNQLEQLCQQLHQTGKLHFRVVYEAEGRSVTLLRTRGAAQP